MAAQTDFVPVSIPLDPAHPARETERWAGDGRHAMLLRALGVSRGIQARVPADKVGQAEAIAGALGDLYWLFFEGRLRPDDPLVAAGGGSSGVPSLLSASPTGFMGLLGGGGGTSQPPVSRIREALEILERDHPRAGAALRRLVLQTRFSLFRSAAGWQRFAERLAPHLFREEPPPEGGDGDQQGGGGGGGDQAQSPKSRDGDGQGAAQQLAQAIARALDGNGAQDIARNAEQAGQGEDAARQVAASVGDEDLPRKFDLDFARRLARMGIHNIVRLGREIGARLEYAQAGRDNRGVRGRVQGTRNVLALLPHELARLHPSTPPIVRARQMQRLMMGQTLGMDMSPGKADGPVLFVLDESGSMDALRAHAKALFWALAGAVMAEERAVGYVGFSGSAWGSLVQGTEDMLEALASWSGGGTRLALAFQEVQRLLTAVEEMRNADVVVITDAELNDYDARKTAGIMNRLAERGTRISMLVLGNENAYTRAFRQVSRARVSVIPPTRSPEQFIEAAVKVAARVFDELQEE